MKPQTLKRRVLGALHLGEQPVIALWRMLGEPPMSSLHDALVDLSKSGMVYSARTWRLWVWRIV